MAATRAAATTTATPAIYGPWPRPRTWSIESPGLDGEEVNRTHFCTLSSSTTSAQAQSIGQKKNDLKYETSVAAAPWKLQCCAGVLCLLVRSLWCFLSFHTETCPLMWRPTMLESHVKNFFLAICECELRAVLLLLKSFFGLRNC